MSTLHTPKCNTKPGDCSDRVALDVGAEKTEYMFACSFPIKQNKTWFKHIYYKIQIFWEDIREWRLYLM